MAFRRRVFAFLRPSGARRRQSGAWYRVTGLISCVIGVALVAGCAESSGSTAAPTPFRGTATTSAPVASPTGPSSSLRPTASPSTWSTQPSGVSQSTTPPLPAGATSASPVQTVPGNPVPRRIGAIQPTLSALSQAGSRHDERGWATQLSDADLAFLPTATMIYRNLVGLSPSQLDFTATGLQQPLSAARAQVLGDDAFAAQVLITWRLSDDQRSSEHLVWMSFVPQGDDSWHWAGVADAPSQADPTALPIWWLEPVTVHRSDGNVVLAGPGANASLWLSRAQQAAANVTDQLADSLDQIAAPDQGWNHHLVLEIPSSQSRFEEIVGATAGSDSQLAAVTYPDAMDARDAPMRIMLNPAVMASESELGIDIVLTHESTHVATRSPASAAPLWLIEGYADYSAYASYPAGQASAKAGLYASVRRSGAPKSPPSNQRFSPQAHELGLAYAEAWQLCVFLAAHGGQAKLNAFYATVSRSPDANVDRALQTIYGMTKAETLTQWNTALTEDANG